MLTPVPDILGRCYNNSELGCAEEERTPLHGIVQQSTLLQADFSVSTANLYGSFSTAVV